jgi:hypothetical protein
LTLLSRVCFRARTDAAPLDANWLTEGHVMMKVACYFFGALLIVLALLDVFLTVLYARLGTGIISDRLARGMWWLFRVVARPTRSYRDKVLSFCGPVTLVLMIAIWIGALICGGALLIFPNLGTTIRPQSGQTRTDFITAVYISGDNFATLGASDYRPMIGPYKLLYTFLAVIGLATMTLMITYLLEIYSALQSRNTIAVSLHHATGDSGDAAEMIAGVGPQGRFQPGYTHLATVAHDTVHLSESHHFYPVLLYFRDRRPQYALARIALINLDAISLIKSALSDVRYDWLKESAAVSQIWSGTMQLLTELAWIFLPGGLPHFDGDPDEATRRGWARRYRHALLRLHQAGIETLEDERIGEENYIALRAKWDRYIRAFAHYMQHPLDQIDLPGSDPDRIHARNDFTERLRAAG